MAEPNFEPNPWGSITPLSQEQVRRLSALREVSVMGKDATDTLLYANFVLTGSDEIPTGDDRG